MHEVLEKVSSSSPYLAVAEWIRMQHSTIQHSDPQQNATFMTQLNSIFSEAPPGFDSDDWDRLRFAVVIMLLASHESMAIHENLQIITRKGPYFAASLALSEQNRDTTEFCTNLFINVITILERKEVVRHFHDINALHYMMHLPLLLKNALFTENFRPIINRFCKAITDLKFENLSYDTLHFIGIIFMILQELHQKKADLPINQKLFAALTYIFDFAHNSPSIFLTLFFRTWFYFYYRFSNQPQTSCIAELKHEVTILLNKVSNQKYHELTSRFPYPLALRFFHCFPESDTVSRIRLIAFICVTIRNISSPVATIIHEAQSFINEFDHKAYSHPELFFLLTSLTSSIHTYMYKLLTVQGCGRTDVKTDRNECYKKFIPFSQQYNELKERTPFDNLIFSEVLLKDHPSLLDALEDFERILSIGYELRDHLKTILAFQSPVFKAILKEAQSPAAVKTNGMTIAYLIKAILVWGDFIIIATYKQMVIMTFAQKAIKNAVKSRPFLYREFKKLSNLFDFSDMYKPINLLLNKLPPVYIRMTTSMMAQRMFNVFRKGYLTLASVNTVSSILSENGEHTSIYFDLLSKMMEIGASNTDLLLSHKISDCKLLYTWMIYVFRLGSTGYINKQNEKFGEMLKLYQKRFIVAVFSAIKNIAHQTIAMNLLQQYYVAISIHCNEISEEVADNKRMFRPKPLSIDDIEPYALSSALINILQIYNNDPNFMPLQMIIPFLEASFKSGNKKLITAAGAICSKIIQTNQGNKFNRDQMDQFHKLLKLHFESIMINDKEIGLQILNTIPHFAPMFLQYPQPKVEGLQMVEIEGLGVEMHHILKMASSDLDNSTDEIHSLYSLLAGCFEILEKQTHLYTEYAMKMCIKLLCYIYLFEQIIESLKSLSNYITHVFGDAFLRGDSNLYILCLFDIMGRSRSTTTIVAIKHAMYFFEYCVDKPINQQFVAQTVEDLFKFFHPSTRLFSLLSSFSILIKYYPQFIKIDHIRSFLVQTTELFPNDSGFSKLLNQFLKDYLSKTDEETHVKFIALVYEIICPLALCVRKVLEKRVSKLGIPVPIKNLTEIAQVQDAFLFFQRLTLAFLCGTQEGFGDYIPDLQEKVLDFMSPKVQEGVPTFEKLYRVLTLIISILKSRQLFTYFTQSDTFLVHLLHFLCNTMMSHFRPVQDAARKSFAILKAQYINELRCVKQIDDFWRNPNRIFKFWGNQPERIAFYTRLTKIIPERTPPDVIIDFFKETFNFAEMSNVDKMFNIQNLVKILKHFTVEQYILSPEVKNLVLSPYNNEHSYLQFYIQTIIGLSINNDIPIMSIIRKPVIKFLSYFPKETISFLLEQSDKNSIYNFTFLEIILHNDQEPYPLFTAFCDLLESCFNDEFIHPAIFQITQIISVEQRFADNNIFVNLIDQYFDRLIGTCSDYTNHSNLEHKEAMMSRIAETELNIFHFRKEIQRVLTFASIFQLSIMMGSHLYRLFLNEVFEQSSTEFILQIFYSVMETIDIYPVREIEVLVPHCIKKLNKNYIQNTEIWSMIEKLNNHKFSSIYIHALGHYVSNFNPTPVELKYIYNLLSTSLRSLDVQNIIYSFKLVIKLKTRDLLPDTIYYSVIEYLFSYEKFFEMPYLRFVIRILKKGGPLLKDLPTLVAETIAYQFYNKFKSFFTLRGVALIIVEFPELIQALPFSFVQTCVTLLEKLPVEKFKENKIEVSKIVTYCTEYIKFIDPTLEEMDNLYNVIYPFILPILEEDVTEKSFIDNIFTLIIKIKHIPDYFPYEHLDFLGKEIKTHYGFGFVVSAMFVNPNLVINQYRESIMKSMKYIIDQIDVPKCYLKRFLKIILRNYETFKIFSQSIISMADQLVQNFGCDTYEKVFVSIRIIIKKNYGVNYTNWINHLLQINAVDPQFSMLIYTNLLDMLECIPPEDQISYYSVLLSKAPLYENSNAIVRLLPRFITSQYLSIQTKQKIFSSFPKLFKNAKEDTAKVIDALNEYSTEYQIDITIYIIQIIMMSTIKASPSQCLINIEHIDSKLPKERHEKLRFLIQKLPIELWDNSYIPIITALLAERVKMWQPVFAFVPKYINFGYDLLTKILCQLINEETAPLLIEFLGIMVQKEHRSTHTEIITCILYSLHRTGSSVPFTVVQQAIKVSKEGYMFAIYMKKNCPTFRYLLPNSKTDTIFGHLRQDLKPQEATAIALTIMNQYPVAQRLYGFPSNSVFYKKMAIVNSHFTYPEIPTFESILSPLYKIGHEMEPALDEIKIALELTNPEEILKSLERVKEMCLDGYRSHYMATIFEKEKLTVITSFIAQIRAKVLKKPIPLFQRNSKYSALNPFFINLITDFGLLLDNKKPMPKLIINHESTPCILMSPSMPHDFPQVAGFTSRGLYALGEAEINLYFKRISEKFLSNKVEIVDLMNFSAFCFNIFCAQENKENFAIAFGACCKMMVSQMDYSEFYKQTASARIITLLRLAFKHQPYEGYYEPIQVSAKIFKRAFAETWRLWLQQIIELAYVPWFFDVVKELFIDMSYRSTLYAQKYANKDVQYAIKHLISPEPTIQITMMNKLDHCFSSILAIDFEDYERQRNFNSFIDEALKMSKEEIQKIDLLQTRKKRCFITPFEKSLSVISRSSIEAVKDFPSWLEEMRNKTPQEREQIIRLITNSKQLLSHQRSLFMNSIDDFNGNLPFIFPIRFDNNPQTTFIRIHKEIQIISKDLIIVNATTSSSSHSTYLIQRSVHEKGLHATVMTLSTAFFMFRNLLQSSYSSRQRSVLLAAVNCFEIGTNILLVPLQSEAISLDELFTKDMMVSREEWLDKYIPDRQTITEKSREGISELTNDSLKRYLVQQMPEREYIALLPPLARSYIASVLIRYMFSLPYPMMDRIIACSPAAEIPILHTDFDQPLDLSNTSASTFRNSPTIAFVLGKNFFGEFMLDISIIAQAFMSHLETIRAYLDLIIGDDTSIEDFSLSDMLTKRKIIEDRFIELSPPTANATNDECVDWIDGINKLMRKSLDSSIQPIEAIPWF